MAHLWFWVSLFRRCGGSFYKMWWLILGNVVDPFRRCGGSFKEMWWIRLGDVVAHFSTVDVVVHLRIRGSFWKTGWLILG